MTARLLQVLVVVDVQGSVDAGELEGLLPDRRDDRRIFSLRRDGGAPAVVRQGPDAQPIDWMGLGRAVELVAAKIREASEGRTLALYVGGQGPLVVFAHLGCAISKFNGAQWMIARREPGAPLELFPLTGGATTPGLLVLRRLPAEPSPASGQVAVYLDVSNRCVDPVLAGWHRPLTIAGHVENGRDLEGARREVASERRDRRGIQCGPRVVTQDLAVVVVAAGPWRSTAGGADGAADPAGRRQRQR